MKYDITIEIECPPEEVLAKFMNPDHLKHWQKGFISACHLEGVPGKEGCKSKLKYQMGKRKMTLTETITRVDLPSAVHLAYHTNGVYNLQKNCFTPTAHGTRWKSETEFRFTSIYMRLMGLLIPGAFKKQSREYMADFKKFVEKGVTVEHEAN